ncbi:MAG: hypothetical protein PHQ52_03745 [Candidatus Omnitrophica bacterium]|nr:hypothetical protein [Candidatus Omnitrophota bacterium]
MKNNKKYIQPKIRSIKLDPKQSMLQVCRVGGLYLWELISTNIWCSTASYVGMTPGPDCRFTPKGGAGGSTRMRWTAGVCDWEEALPS